MVGPGRLELPTSRLSGVRSNHLSYGPISVNSAIKPRSMFLDRKRNVDGDARHIVRMVTSLRRISVDGRLTGAIYVLKSTGRFIQGHILRCVPGVLPIPQLP